MPQASSPCVAVAQELEIWTRLPATAPTPGLFWPPPRPGRPAGCGMGCARSQLSLGTRDLGGEGGSLGAGCGAKLGGTRAGRGHQASPSCFRHSLGPGHPLSTLPPRAVKRFVHGRHGSRAHSRAQLRSPLSLICDKKGPGIWPGSATAPHLCVFGCLAAQWQQPPPSAKPKRVRPSASRYAALSDQGLDIRAAFQPEAGPSPLALSPGLVESEDL